MAKYMTLYTVHEEEYDKNGDYVRTYDENLPHSSAIVKELTESWNDMHSLMLDLINKECDNRIESCRMRQYNKKSGKTTICVEWVAKKGKQLTGWIKDSIDDFFSAQCSDGWGEGVFDFPRDDAGASYAIV